MAAARASRPLTGARNSRAGGGDGRASAATAGSGAGSGAGVGVGAGAGSGAGAGAGSDIESLLRLVALFGEGFGDFFAGDGFGEGVCFASPPSDRKASCRRSTSAALSPAVSSPFFFSASRSLATVIFGTSS